MADRLKLAQGLRNLPASAREDLAGREQDIQRGKTVELLRRAGKEMYENPIVNTAVGLSPVLGDIQAGVEAYRSAQEGDWGNAGLNAMGMLPFIPMLGKTVWHGSPHTFEKFDLSKIGTGEGAQSYGHGLYLAEAKPTAQKYAQDLSSETFRVGNEVFDPNTLQHLNVRTQARSGNVDEAINKALQLSQSDSPVANLARQDLEVLQNIKAQGGMVPNEGQLYKVDLPDEQIAKMLDWDKPLSEQPEAYKAIENYARETQGNQENAMRMLEGKTAGEAYSMWKQPEYVSQFLNEQGIPGIQYLDQASRGAGDGTRNYVVFSDEIPQILERNNQPLVNALRNTEYRGSHTAPGPDFGARLDDLTGGGQMYPEDVYSPQAVRYYGTGDTKLDKESFAIAQRMRNKPDEMIDIYRAVPNDADISAINAGDWVTINPNYAKQHGESNLPEGYKILSQKVPAKSVWTNADSIHEYGYWPE